MAQLLQTEISGSNDNTGSLIITGSQPIQLPLLNSGSGEVTSDVGYQFWFDSGDQYVKYNTIGSFRTGAWSAGGSMIITRAYSGGAGFQNSALAIGGIAPGSSYQTSTEEYNGSSWVSGGSMSIARRSGGGLGTQNSALYAGGFSGAQQAETEEYDGSAWSNGGNIIQSRNSMGSSGTQNASLISGGGTPTVVSCTEEYNGSSWASGGARINVMNASTQ